MSGKMVTLRGGTSMPRWVLVSGGTILGLSVLLFAASRTPTSTLCGAVGIVVGFAFLGYGRWLSSSTKK